MKSWGLTMAASIVVALLAPLAAAQDKPDRPPRPPMDGREDNRPGDDRRPGPPGAQRPEPPEMRRFELMRGYIDLVDRFSRLSRDPSTAGVAAVIAAADILKQRSPEAAIEYFNKTLPDAKNQAVQRAIRIQLVELYRNSGQNDKAIEQLDVLIKGAGTDSAPARD